jgi:hypothetical protein
MRMRRNIPPPPRIVIWVGERNLGEKEWMGVWRLGRISNA